MLTDKIQQDQINALKAREEQKLSVLRFLSAGIKNLQIEKQQPLTDDDVVDVIRKQVKKLEDAAALFEKGGRPEMAADNKKQVAILSVYLPAEITDEVLKTKIQQIIEANRELYEKNPKAITGIVMGKLKSAASPARIMAILNSL